jgi:plastocyanin domain-containing protein
MNTIKKDKVKLGLILIVLISILAFIGFIYIQNNVRQDLILASDVTSNVTNESGVQVIRIKAKEGFTPQITVARAGVKSILKIDASDVIDCSNSVSIPDLGVKNELIALNSTGEFEIANPKVGTMNGSCSMGMYDFKIKFI